MTPTYSEIPELQAAFAESYEAAYAEGVAQANAEAEREIGRALGRAEREGCTPELTAHIDRMRAEGQTPADLADFATRFVAAHAEGRAMARERIMLILESPEAKGRRDMAIYLATETDLPADVAIAQLRGVASVHSIAARAAATILVRPH